MRALEDRVGDVEKWLVDKEEARQKAEAENKAEMEKTISAAISRIPQKDSVDVAAESLTPFGIAGTVLLGDGLVLRNRLSDALDAASICLFVCWCICLA